MTRNLILAGRLREVFLNGHWIANTNYREQLLSMNWQKATQKLDNLNTIAVLTYHVNYYLAGILDAFETGELRISDKYSFGLPQIRSGEDWNKLITVFLNNAEKFATHVEQLDDSIFDQPFVNEKYGTWLRNIEGILEHSYYHLGQIVLLRKIIMQNSLQALI